MPHLLYMKLSKILELSRKKRGTEGNEQTAYFVLNGYEQMGHIVNSCLKMGIGVLPGSQRLSEDNNVDVLSGLNYTCLLQICYLFGILYRRQ